MYVLAKIITLGKSLGNAVFIHNISKTLIKLFMIISPAPPALS